MKFNVISFLIVITCIGITIYFVLKPPPIYPVEKLRENSPQITKAYQLAEKYSSTFKKIKCYCGCMNGSKNDHSSLRTCFESDHGSTCVICIDEAIFVGEQKKLNTPDLQIKQLIDKKYSGNN